ncbi:MAG: sodium:calcium antiporter [bacterium]|nr:sodium:calcium antiporter [bacterium]
MEYITYAFWILLSILLIGKGSDWLTDSLIPMARKLGVSGVAVGIILVSVAVSLPEVLVALYTTYKGYVEITFGVILGSIFVNIGLMTGLSALFRPLHVTRNLILRDGIFSIVVPILVFAVGASGKITRIEGFAFALLFIPYVINVFLIEKQETTEEKGQEVKQVETELGLLGFDFGKFKSGTLSFALGVGMLLLGAQIFSNQLISITEGFNVSQLIIGFTLGAIGPSIPNIAAAYKATKKGMGEVAVSETLGSNIFTLLVTLGITAMFVPITLEPQWLRFDLPALIVMSCLLFLFIITKHRISRLEGGVLLGGYLLILLAQIYLGTR